MLIVLKEKKRLGTCISDVHGLNSLSCGIFTAEDWFEQPRFCDSRC